MYVIKRWCSLFRLGVNVGEPQAGREAIYTVAAP
jgi:hypothetical protein